MDILRTIIMASEMMYFAFVGFVAFLETPVFTGWGASSILKLADKLGATSPLLQICDVVSLDQVTVLQLLFASVPAVLLFKLVKWLWDLLPIV